MDSLEKTGPVESPSGRNPIFDLGPGAHECWYPVALSSSVPTGKVIGREIGDGRIIVYRGEDGAVRAMSAYCKHMGADLSVGGEVQGNNIRCPFHHWAYGDGGQCKNIPAGDKIPRRANLFQFASREQFGLIWVFFGKTPLYDIQTFDDFDEEKHVARSYEIQLGDKLDCEPWIFTTNVFDIAHLRFLHGINIVNSDVEEIDTYRRRMSWVADMGAKAAGGLRMDIDVYGMNSLRTKGDQGGRLKWYIAGSVPSVREGTKFFLTIVTTNEPGAEEFLDRQAAMHTQIINEDIPILNNMRLDELLLVPSDRAMTRFMRSVVKYPRVTMKALERSARLD
jgi:phenylpropionate dioxygenase-like ring-hydroxylating dioxygenase large terminal subunit